MTLGRGHWPGLCKVRVPRGGSALGVALVLRQGPPHPASGTAVGEERPKAREERSVSFCKMGVLGII